jgi:hypothetical protein
MKNPDKKQERIEFLYNYILYNLVYAFLLLSTAINIWCAYVGSIPLLKSLLYIGLNFGVLMWVWSGEMEYKRILEKRKKKE